MQHEQPSSWSLLLPLRLCNMLPCLPRHGGLCSPKTVSQHRSFCSHVAFAKTFYHNDRKVDQELVPRSGAIIRTNLILLFLICGINLWKGCDRVWNFGLEKPLNGTRGELNRLFCSSSSLKDWKVVEKWPALLGFRKNKRTIMGTGLEVIYILAKNLAAFRSCSDILGKAEFKSNQLIILKVDMSR